MNDDFGRAVTAEHIADHTRITIGSQQIVLTVPGLLSDAQAVAKANEYPPPGWSSLELAKIERIEANRAECSGRIFERYPAGRQLSASFGLYDSANVATMVDWIAANVAAENTAADAIEAATTVAAVEAVTVAWPV